MSCCTARCLVITICVLQFVTTVERLVFDFLGYMWAPIIGSFLQIIFIIVGFFGALQYRPKVVIVYVLWMLVWLGWNIFVICFYLEVGVLDRDSDILNIGTGHKSWWFDNGLGCHVTNDSWKDSTATSSDLGSRLIPPESAVQGCLIQYYYVEVIHAGVQCILGLSGFCVGCLLIYIFTEEDDSSQPVHDELEYIKMRYKSPARSSFRDNKTYETLTTTRSTYSTSDRGVDGPHCSDDSLISEKTTKSSSTVERRNKLNAETPPSKKKDQSTPLPPTPPHGHRFDNYNIDQRSFPGDQRGRSTNYNIIGDSQGVTVV